VPFSQGFISSTTGSSGAFGLGAVVSALVSAAAGVDQSSASRMARRRMRFGKSLGKASPTGKGRISGTLVEIHHRCEVVDALLRKVRAA
jgi:hypothetical protein